MTCTSIAEALKHGVVTAMLPKNPLSSVERRLIVGIVPDGISTVVVSTPGNKSPVVPVVRNVFVLRDSVNEPPESVEFASSARG